MQKTLHKTCRKRGDFHLVKFNQTFLICMLISLK